MGDRSTAAAARWHAVAVPGPRPRDGRRSPPGVARWHRSPPVGHGVQAVARLLKRRSGRDPRPDLDLTLDDFDSESTIIESFIVTSEEVDRDEPKLIHTIRGVGYSLREPA